MRCTPGIERGQHLRRAGLHRMHEIAEKDDVPRGVRGDQSVEPREVLLRGAARHRLAQRAIGRGLADVQVGNEQHALAGPPERALGQQVEALAGPLDSERGRGKVRRGHGRRVSQKTPGPAAALQFNRASPSFPP